MSAPENLQAFPAAYCVGPSDDMYPPEPGMTLRDWFAGQALPSVIADATAGGSVDGTGTVYDMLSQAAYRFADAMLAERAKGGAS
jgi:hypothetical protein